LFPLSDQTVVYPGHGAKTTIGYEKKYNPYAKEAKA
jgi:glyoxylase-like metal-dependent hydrolase (beta-lactamase superfamily II)